MVSYAEFLEPIDRRATLRGAVANLWYCDDAELLLDGPAGTGKTFGLIRRCDWLARKYRGARILWVRETLQSLRESVQAIYEEYVLWPGHPVLLEGGKRHQRGHYHYPDTDAEIVLAGLDTPERLMSTEYDFIAVFEATNPNVTEKAWAFLSTRNRGQHIPHPHCNYPDGLLPDGRTTREALMAGEFTLGEDENGKPLFWNQMVADCNPESEQHWLWRRFTEGRMTRLRSTHADNPLVTRSYLQRLEGLPGVYRERLLEGKWVASEGVIWSTFNKQRHLVTTRFEFDSITGRRYVEVPEWTDDQGRPAQFQVAGVVAGMDWGFTAPGCLSVLAHCVNGMTFLLAEVYAADRGLEWWADQIVPLVDEFRIECIRCDHDPDNIRALNKALGPRKGREVGGIAQQADKKRTRRSAADLAGLDVVREGFRANRLFIDRYAGRYTDPVLDLAHLPTGIVGEIGGYCFDTDKKTGQRLEVPPDNAIDHACDALRYAYMDIAARTWTKPKDVRFVAPEGVVAYYVGTPEERARLRQLEKRRARYRLN
jgi:hypothetical protein